MQTVYFETSNFIRHDGNIVDLTEYRRKLARAQAAEQPAAAVSVQQPSSEATAARRTRRRSEFALGADWAASAVIVATMLTFMVKIL